MRTITFADIAKEAGVSTATVSRYFNEADRVTPDTAQRIKSAVEKLGYSPGQRPVIKTTTIDEVAKLASVSKATVSRVLNNSNQVLDKTRAEVLQAMEKLNYQPNMTARYLRRQETKLIGIVLPDISNPFYSKVLKGIEEVACSLEYDVVLLNTNYSEEREKKCLQTLSERRAGGFCFMCHRLNDEKVKHLEKFGLPYVMISRTISHYPHIPFVNVDNVRGGYDATRHLIDLGHRQIGIIAGPSDDECSSLDRVAGYKLALLEAGIPFRPEYVGEGDFTYGLGEKLAKELMTLPEPPTAIFAVSDEMAIGAIKGLRSIGLSIPEDVSIIGFDNLEMSYYSNPPLSTIAQPMTEMGRKAAEILTALIEHRPLEKVQVVLPHTLMSRESSIAYHGSTHSLSNRER